MTIRTGTVVFCGLVCIYYITIGYFSILLALLPVMLLLTFLSFLVAAAFSSEAVLIGSLLLGLTCSLVIMATHTFEPLPPNVNGKKLWQPPVPQILKEEGCTIQLASSLLVTGTLGIVFEYISPARLMTVLAVRFLVAVGKPPSWWKEIDEIVSLAIKTPRSPINRCPRKESVLAWISEDDLAKEKKAETH